VKKKHNFRQHCCVKLSQIGTTAALVLLVRTGWYKKAIDKYSPRRGITSWKRRKTYKSRILTNKFRRFPARLFHCQSQGFRNGRIWYETWRWWRHLCSDYNKPRLITDNVQHVYTSLFLNHYYRSVLCRTSYLVLKAQLLQTCKRTSSSLHAISFANPFSFLRVRVAWNWFHENRIFLSGHLILNFIESHP
jgi:hypothetical protein